jgi:hypothetical protein
MDLAKELSPLLLWGLGQIENAKQKPAIQMPKVTYFGNVLKDVKENSGEATAHTIDRLERAHKDETDAWYGLYKAEHERVKALEREVDELRGRGGDTSRFFENRHEYPWRKEPVAKPGNETTRSGGPGWGPITVTESPYQ